MAGSVHIPWYATGFRADKLEAALAEFAPIALRYGASSYQVFRYRDDRYKFLHTMTFEDKAQWEAFWYGPAFNRFRAMNSSYYQVPLVYQWADIAAEGSLGYDPIQGGEPASVTGGSAGEVGDTI